MHGSLTSQQRVSSGCDGVSGTSEVEMRGDTSTPVLESQPRVFDDRVSGRISSVTCRLVKPVCTKGEASDGDLGSMVTSNIMFCDSKCDRRKAIL